MINFFRIGVITSLHGLNGEFKCLITSSDVNRFNDLKEIYLVPKNLYDDFLDNSNLYIHIVNNVKYINKKVIISVYGIDTIDKAKKFLNAEIYIDRKNALPLRENEYFIPDLIGLSVSDTIRGYIGKVVDVDLAIKDSILIVKKNDKEILIPMNSHFIKNIDINKSQITVELLEGMIDDI